MNRIVSLLRDNPTLVLPVVAADLLGFAAMHVQHALQQPLFVWFFKNKQSVLATANSTFVLTPENAQVVFFLVAPMIWACYFLSIVFYTGALLAIAVLTRRIEEDRPSGLQVVYSHLARNGRRLFIFSASMFGAMIITAILFGGFVIVSDKIPWLASKMGRDFGYFSFFPFELALIYLFTRPALNLLRASRSQLPLTVERIAKLLGVAAITTQLAFLLIIEHVAPAVLFQQKTVIGFLIREVVLSLIAALPYVPFFIGLVLLAGNTETFAPDADLEKIDGA